MPQHGEIQYDSTGRAEAFIDTYRSEFDITKIIHSKYVD